MKFTLALAFGAATLATSALADAHLGSGDPEAGEKTFNRCKSCHMIVDDAGETIVRGGRTGPNLYGVIGRQAGTIEDFRYGDSIVAAGEAGLVWDEENFLVYVQDPQAFLREYLGDNSARSKMTFKLPKGGEDVYSYLASLAPPPES
jgi:cytochrome c